MLVPVNLTFDRSYMYTLEFDFGYLIRIDYVKLQHTSVKSLSIMISEYKYVICIHVCVFITLA